MSKIYSPSEVSLHTSKKDCWLIIHGKVYDVTTFLEDHPGGEDALLHASDVASKSLRYYNFGSLTVSRCDEKFWDVCGCGGQSPRASGDATESFEDVGHSSSAASMMENYFIGSVEGYTKAGSQNSIGKAPAAAASSSSPSSSSSSSSFLDFLLPLIVLAVAFAAWYYLTFKAKAKTGDQDL